MANVGCNLCFISHASEDAALASLGAVELEGRGIECWIAPRDIEAGGNYAERIPDAIDRSRAMVVLVSRASMASDHVMRELNLAVERQVAIFPVRIEEVEPQGGFRYLLGPAQRTDALQEPREEALKVAMEKVANDLLGREEEVERGEVEVGSPSAGGRGVRPVLRRRTVLWLTGVGTLATVSGFVATTRPWRINDEELVAMRDFEVGIETHGGDGVYREGDAIYFKVRVEYECFLVLVYDDGTTQDFAYPNVEEPDSRIRRIDVAQGGPIEVIIPPEGAGLWTLKVEEIDTSSLKVIAVAATREERLEELFEGAYQEAKRQKPGKVSSRGLRTKLAASEGERRREDKLGIGVVEFATRAGRRGGGSV